MNEIKTLRPYCGVGCGLNVYVESGKVVRIARTKDSPEAKRLFAEFDFPRADVRTALLSRDYHETSEIPKNEFPFNLNSGKSVTHFNTKTRTRRIPNLNKLASHAIAYLSKEDGQKRNIQNKKEIARFSKRGSINVKVNITAQTK